MASEKFRKNQQLAAIYVPRFLKRFFLLRSKTFSIYFLSVNRPLKGQLHLHFSHCLYFEFLFLTFPLNSEQKLSNVHSRMHTFQILSFYPSCMQQIYQSHPHTGTSNRKTIKTNYSYNFFFSFNFPRTLRRHNNNFNNTEINRAYINCNKYTQTSFTR